MNRGSQSHRILLLTQWYDPEPAFRPAQLAAGLAERGFDVTVVTSFPSYPQGRTYAGHRQRLRRTSGGNPKVIRVPSVPSRSLSLFHRGLSYASFALAAAAFGITGVRRPCAIWAYQPPPSIALPALLAKLIYRAPVVYEIQDMWPDTLVASGVREEGRLTRSIAWAMGRILARVERVVVISNGFARLVAERGVPHDRVEVIPNWPAVSVPPAGQSRRDPRTAFELLYAGNVGVGQRLDFVVRAIAMANADAGTRRRIALTVLGEGPALATVTEAATTHDVELRIMERVDAHEVPGIAADFDALLVNLADAEVFRTTIPSKLVTYLAMGKPILGGLAGDGARIIEAARAGLTFPPEDLGAAVDALTRLAAAGPAELAEMGENSRRAFEEGFQADDLIDRYAELFERLIEQRRAPRPRRTS